MGRKAKYLYLVLSLSLDRRGRGNVRHDGSGADLRRHAYMASECWKSQIPFPRTLILNFSMGWCPRTDLPSRTYLYPPHGLLVKRKVVMGGYRQTRFFYVFIDRENCRVTSPFKHKNLYERAWRNCDMIKNTVSERYWARWRYWQSYRRFIEHMLIVN